MSLVCLYYNMTFKPKMGQALSSVAPSAKLRKSEHQEATSLVPPGATPGQRPGSSERLCVECWVLESSMSPLSHCGWLGVGFTELLPAPRGTLLADMRDELVMASWGEGVPVEWGVRMLAGWDDNVKHLPFTLNTVRSPSPKGQTTTGKGSCPK